MLDLRVPRRTRTESPAHPMAEKIATISGNTVRLDGYKMRHHIILRRAYLQMRWRKESRWFGRCLTVVI
jgi:hypothetical protein